MTQLCPMCGEDPSHSQNPKDNSYHCTLNDPTKPFSHVVLFDDDAPAYSDTKAIIVVEEFAKTGGRLEISQNLLIDMIRLQIVCGNIDFTSIVFYGFDSSPINVNQYGNNELLFVKDIHMDVTRDILSHQCRLRNVRNVNN